MSSDPNVAFTNFSFNVSLGEERRTISHEDLAPFADFIGLSKIAPGRFSWLFVVQVLLNDLISGVDPDMIVQEVKALESGKPSLGTKPASEFNREPLKGLWHKHYFSAHFIGRNMSNYLSGGKLHQFLSEVLDPGKSPNVTREMIAEIAHRVVEEPLDVRANTEKLTGEWIVFAKHGGQNYYLCLAKHDTGDQAIYDQIDLVAFKQFPFLRPGQPS
jgi:hypothetical protein